MAKQHREGEERSPMEVNFRPRILASGPHALPSELAEFTDVLPPTKDRWWEPRLRSAGLRKWADRSRSIRRSWALFTRLPQIEAVITVGDLEGLALAAMRRLLNRDRCVQVMGDGCYWYGGSWLRRRCMRFCLAAVDRCVVPASVERARYAHTYGVPAEKFAFVPYHNTLKKYTYEVGDDGYIFTGGNADRDFGLFFEAVRGIDAPCILASNRPSLLRGLEVPRNVALVSVSPSEFRQLMARARIVVMPMRATLLHAGAQQSMLNAMTMGKPVVLTDPEGGSDYIDHGRTGLLVPYGDVTQLRSAVQYLMAQPEEARAMGERAKLAAAPLTTERCNTAVWNIALDLIAERRSGSALPQRAKGERVLEYKSGDETPGHLMSRQPQSGGDRNRPEKGSVRQW